MPKLKVIPSRLYRGPALVGAVAFAFATTAPADPVWDKVGEAFGKAGTKMPGGVYRIALPRTDIKATLDGVELKLGFALGGWLAFQKMGDAAMVMGDLVLTQDEVNPVMAKLLARGMEVTALHNHLLRNTPVHDVHARLRARRSSEAGDRAARETRREQDANDGCRAIGGTTTDRSRHPCARPILGAKGTNNGGVYGYGIRRADPINDSGMIVPASMGSAIGINFQPTDGGQAAITGDFVLLGSELEPVVKALRDNGIEVTATHNHMVHEQPRLFFLHFWANDDAKKVAQGLRAALDHINVAKG
jgi:hypothetical protein